MSDLDTQYVEYARATEILQTAYSGVRIMGPEEYLRAIRNWEEPAKSDSGNGLP